MLRYETYEQWRRGNPLAIASLCALLESLGVESSEDAVNERFAGRRNVDIYQELLECADPYELLVDKTPAYSSRDKRLERVKSIEPVFVWLIRHPLAVAHSRIKRSWKKLEGRTPGQSWSKYLWQWSERRVRALTGSELSRELWRWRTVQRRIEHCLADVPAERKVIVYYERLVQDPESSVKAMAHGLGLSFDPSMLETSQNLPTSLKWGLGDETILSRKKIDAQSVEKWRERFRPEEIDRETLELMHRLGVE
jgi:hypothetical protein